MDESGTACVASGDPAVTGQRSVIEIEPVTSSGDIQHGSGDGPCVADHQLCGGETDAGQFAVYAGFRGKEMGVDAIMGVLRPEIRTAVHRVETERLLGGAGEDGYVEVVPVDDVPAVPRVVGKCRIGADQMVEVIVA